MEHKIKGCNALIHKILDQMLEYGPVDARYQRSGRVRRQSF